ncbi:MAG: exonuclease domain-containing protein [Eubacteriaceae bacterium]|jgi:DNA polymerase-3 subunit epsilon
MKTREHRGSSIIDLPSDYTLIDIETTGLSPYYDSIIEVSAIKYRDDKHTDTFSTLVYPGFEIPEFISQLTGITNKMLIDSPEFKQIANPLFDFIADDTLIGQNVSFDINFLYDILDRTASKYLANDFVDTLRLSRKLYPDLNSHSLDTMIEYLELDESRDLHRSENDCMLTNQMYQIMKKEINNRYASTDDFISLFRPSRRFHKRSLAELLAMKPTTDCDHSDSPLCGRVCVFTGSLDKLNRKDAQQLVVNFGGINGNTVTKKTNFLILGNNDYCKSIKDGKSSKQKKAEAYILKGQDLQILPEDIFYEYVLN